MNPTKEEILKAVDDEEEYNGEMPRAMKKALDRADIDTIIAALRITVRLTKKGIRDRIEGLYVQNDKR
jgi:hypothetical protein